MLFQHHCWNDYLFSPIVLPLLLCQNSVDYIYVSLFLGSLFCSTDDVFVYSFKSGCHSSLTLFFPSILSWLFCLFCFTSPCNFRVSLSIITKWLPGILTGIALDLHIKLGRTDIVTILPSYPWIWNIPPFIWFSFYFFHQFCRFPHIDLKHTLLDVYLSISFGGGANVNGLVVFNFKVCFMAQNAVCLGWMFHVSLRRMYIL